MVRDAVVGVGVAGVVVIDGVRAGVTDSFATLTLTLDIQSTSGGSSSTMVLGRSVS